MIVDVYFEEEDEVICDYSKICVQTIPRTGEHISFDGSDIYLVTGVVHHVNDEEHSITLLVKYDA